MVFCFQTLLNSIVEVKYMYYVLRFWLTSHKRTKKYFVMCDAWGLKFIYCFTSRGKESWYLIGKAFILTSFYLPWGVEFFFSLSLSYSHILENFSTWEKEKVMVGETVKTFQVSSSLRANKGILACSSLSLSFSLCLSLFFFFNK